LWVGSPRTYRLIPLITQICDYTLYSLFLNNKSLKTPQHQLALSHQPRNRSIIASADCVALSPFRLVPSGRDRVAPYSAASAVPRVRLGRRSKWTPVQATRRASTESVSSVSIRYTLSRSLLGARWFRSVTT